MWLKETAVELKTDAQTSVMMNQGRRCRVTDEGRNGKKCMEVLGVTVAIITRDCDSEQRWI
jgi:hypothetical protein